MTKIDIFSGFLGAGKTTLIKKLLKEALAGTKVVLIENEFGEIGVDGGFLQESGIEIKEMNSGCICCSLVGDFGASLKEVLDTYQPERILIEPSGVGKLSDVVKAVQGVDTAAEVQLNSAVAVVDAKKCKMYMKNFGEFFVNQIEHAGTIILSRTGDIAQDKLEKCVEMIREHNDHAVIITTPWEQLDGQEILKTIEGTDHMDEDLLKEVMEEQEHHHHHEHDEECCCGHDHGHEGHHHEHDEHCNCGHEHEHEHEHEHHHEHDEHCGCGHDHDHEHEHEHHHEHDEHCCCGHDHGHEGHHHANEVFTSWGKETPAKYDKKKIEDILEKLEDAESYGMVLRAKGMVPAEDGTWIYFDYVPGESNVRIGSPCVTGKLCVIGSGLQEEKLEELFCMKPVYIINGFLESGKSEFITYTLEQPYFQVRGKTLLLLCEEGEVEYEEELLKKSRTVVEVIEDEEEFTPANLIELEKKHKPERIIIEYNGMWNYKEMKLPWHWRVEQQMTMIDASTFPTYYTNMRSLLAEMLRKSEMIIFNRCDGIEDLGTYKRNIKAINQQAEIIFEDSNGEIDTMFEEDLPYDVKADFLELDDNGYGIWYLDTLDHLERYIGKTVQFTAMVLLPEKMKKGYFVPGRMAMTCCADDMAFLGYACKYDGAENLKQKSWVKVTAKVQKEYWEDYNGEGPVLHAVSVEPTKAPKNEVISFV